MPAFPSSPTDFFDAASQALGGTQALINGFQTQSIDNSNGLTSLQSKIRNNRPAVSTRHAVYWLVPEGPIVQMYINPQSIREAQKKDITNQRTRGGYVIQYWGPALGTLSIEGTTGTSGIEGINVLENVYLAEQNAMDPYNLFLAAKQDQERYDFLGLGTGPNPISGNISNFLLKATQQQSASRSKPSLAALALTVEMYWSGLVYRGYFTSFDVTESVSNLGMFDYNIAFTYTQKRGVRNNFLAWHRSATSGQSNSDPNFGTPYSFGAKVNDIR